jgi:hypothetical protein
MQQLEGSGTPVLYVGRTVLKGYRPSPYRAVNTFNLGYKNQSLYAVSVPSHCLFSEKCKTHKYSVGRAYSC